MKYVKYLMALAALCILAMPAFSMPDDRDTAKDGTDQAIDDQAPAFGPAGEDGPHPGDCQMPIGQDCRKLPCHKHIKSMMSERGPDGMQGAHPNMAEMGQDGKQGPEPGEPVIGDNACGKQGPKPVMSMMGDKNCGPDGHKHIKSMMGDMEHGPAGARTIIVNLNL